MPNYDPIGPRPPKRKPSSPTARKMQKPRPSSGTSPVPSRRTMPRPARTRYSDIDDMGPFQKPYRRPTGQQMPKPSGRSGSVSSSGPKRNLTGKRQTPAGKMMPKKKTSFYGQRPAPRGRMGR